MFEGAFWVFAITQVFWYNIQNFPATGTSRYGINPRHEEGKIKLIKKSFYDLI